MDDDNLIYILEFWFLEIITGSDDILVKVCPKNNSVDNPYIRYVFLFLFLLCPCLFV